MHHAILPALLLLAACAGKNTRGPLESDKFFVENRVVEKQTPEGLILAEIDTDEDKRPEVFNFYRPRANDTRLLVRKEVDLDRDGKVDMRSYFDDEGNLEREEMDRNFDGKVDWIDHYQDGKRVMSEVDTDGDGRMNTFSYYEKNARNEMFITIKERDTDGDGLIDYWERFDDKGNVVKTGRDTDGDGVMDEREE